MACSCGKDTCGCSIPQVVSLRDESGAVHSFYISDRVTVMQQEYVLLSGLENSDLVALLRVERQADGTEHYRNIESDAEWMMLQETLFQPR